MIAGATAQGVCFLEWHDRGGVERIKARVSKRYRRELIEGDCSHLGVLESELKEYFNGKRSKFAVSIDVSGTPFEEKVWKMLLAVPYGRTRCYGELAAEMGNPGASRAVGRANGANYLSILIPCHRIVEAGGGLRGYGGGLWRKKRLLEIESGVQAITVLKLEANN